MSLVVLPDAGVAPATVTGVTACVGPVLARHRSGAPWLLGSPGARRLVGAGNADLDVVAVGLNVSPDDEARLERAVRGKRSVRDLDDLAATFAEGDTLVFARDADALRVQPPVFRGRSVFWAIVEGVAVASDEQIVLRDLAGLQPDEVVLASRLTNAEVSYPFNLASIWRGIHGVGPGQWLHQRRDRMPEAVTWWTPPEPDGSVENLAPALHAAIVAALSERTAHHDTVSADLSGGLDSTSLNFFLRAIRPRHHSLFLTSGNPVNNDHRWAERAAHELDTDHHVAPYSSLFPYVSDVRAGTVDMFPEGPDLGLVATAACAMIADLLKDTGTTLHLNGHAGDALFATTSTVMWSLFHSREPRRLRRVWRSRVANRHRLGATARAILRNQSYLHDLGRVQRGVTAEPGDVAEHSRWVHVPHLHPALTDRAGQAVRELATRGIREHPHALAECRTNHHILQYLVAHGNGVRRMNLGVSPSTGIYFDSPYLDRRVVEASIALRIGARAHQSPVKPLLAAARPASMSVEYFLRRDKGEYSAEVFQQHQAIRPVLRDLFSGGSALEDLGLVSPERIRQSVSDFATDAIPFVELVYIAFVERWLRSLSRDRAGAR